MINPLSSPIMSDWEDNLHSFKAQTNASISKLFPKNPGEEDSRFSGFTAMVRGLDEVLCDDDTDD